MSLRDREYLSEKEGRAERIKRRSSEKVGNIPAIAVKAKGQLASGNMHEGMKSIAKILAELSWTVDAMSAMDEDRFDDLSKYVDKAYSAAGRITYKGLPSKLGG